MDTAGNRHKHMSNRYYAEKLSGQRLDRVYAIAGARVRRYLEAEIAHVRTLVRPGDRVLELGCGTGRVLAASGISLLTQVQLRKEDQLYINDGIYGSLSEMVQTNLRLPARLIRLNEQPSEETTAFTLNGPTCDSLDVIPGTFDLPSDAREGDWIEIDQVGAYSNALATHFSGFHPETFVEVHDEPLAAET